MSNRTYDCIRKPFDASARRFVPPRSPGLEATSFPLPTAVDLRPLCPPVYDQGPLGSCFDSQTEVLTRNGWRLFSDVTLEDELASVDPKTKNLIFENPTRLIKKLHKGKVYHVQHESLDFVVTPDHEMIVRPWIESERTLASDYSRVPMESVGWYVGLINSVQYKGTSNLETYTLKGVSCKLKSQRKDLEVPIVPFLRFLGIYLAEGTLLQETRIRDGRIDINYKIQIAASKDREKGFIRQILADLDLYALELEDRFTFSNKRLYKAMEDLGLLGVKAPEKFVPDFIFDLGADLINEFLLGHLMGDGCTNEDHISHYTSSPQLADDLQTLIVLSGSWSTIGVRGPRSSVMQDGRKVNGVHPEYRVSRWKSKNLSIDRKENVSIEDYDGTVYCAEVPTYHTLVTRRNGKILVAGNCTGNGWAFMVEWVQHLNKFKRLWTPSRMFIYYDERVLEHHVDRDAGASVADGGRVVTTLGACKETTWPYVIQNYRIKPSVVAYIEAAKYKIRSVSTIDNTNVEAVKTAVASYHPVVMGFDVYQTFESDQVAANGLVSLPGPQERLLGGHCTVIVGYNDAFKFPDTFGVSPGCYIVRNSWGSSWGLNGYFLVPYSYFSDQNLASDFWTASGITGTS